MPGNFVCRRQVEPRVKLLRAERRIISFSTEIYRRVEKISTIIGTLMEIENCQKRGQVLQGSRCWVKNHRMDFYLVREGD